MPASAITIAVIDGHDVAHAGIDAWCAQADPSIKVVGNFHSPTEMLARYPDVPNELDVVVFDVFVDGDRPAFAALRAMCQAGQRVIVYSQLSTDEVILTCLDVGAVSYLVKTEGQRHLIDAIRAAHSREPYVGPQMAKALANDRTLGRTNLSEREKEVLINWFQTESKDLVGSRLYIAPTTVRTHLQRARAKYAAVGRPAPTKAALLARAIEDGLLSLSDL
ncbi:LuxR C-terminal-related transcriptional regulator [Mycolicibacter kumamotonensis]|uniref:LuxR family transcriptional regulator n=1 Tax=Mycolicibacter kumamotonensis TaxID=354243 RepID=A0A1B8S8J5_9MYCO|nr:LuxR C-terminal-related transcriptional regulator [Mycolicibacter kumamotonensis]OBY29068.1 LuxR family transcriptional regulator [Mycolicibacter kumamotonensis]